MDRLRRFLKIIFIPVTIMMVPHSRTKSVSFRVPLAGICLSALMICAGMAYVYSVSVRTVEYYRMRENLDRITMHYQEVRATIHSLKLAETKFRKMFELKSKKELLETADFSDSGSLDMELLKKQIHEAMESATDIQKYIMQQKDIFLATPIGFPVDGHVSSGYGSRNHPVTGEPAMHSGLDLSVPQGTPVRATANGIVSFSGWTSGGGNVVVIEHGYGLSTAFAHNSKNLVKVGQRVKREEAIAVSGSTGISTGPHVHYEIWKNGRHVNPANYIAGR